ncbi:MAG: hypothetical protein BGO01_18415 [Armatimonadetes bacterium 55-13]|nr:SRPBCC domain-containing protein [Armatimonadota bacterium]OJU64109.1 MAG: hypothetical protein BGO01_18415 [Armatimonadetes bacterium 55-13]
MTETMDLTTATRTLTIKASPERLFEALTTPDQLKTWFCDGIETDLKVGGPFRFWGRTILGTGTAESARQTLSALEPPKSLEVQWPYEGFDSVLSYEVQPADGGSSVLAKHVIPGNTDYITLAMSHDGLKVALYNLRHYLENGEALVQFDLTNLTTTVTCSVTIQAPKEDVWAALTDPEKMDIWISEGAKVDLQEGGDYSYGWGLGPEKILGLKEGECLVTDWHFEDEPNTTVEWTLEGDGGTTTLKLTHSGFTQPDQTRGYNQGWGAFLGAIKAVVEGRDLAEKTA